MKTTCIPRRRKWILSKVQRVFESALYSHKRDDNQKLFAFLNQKCFQSCLPYIPVKWMSCIWRRGVELRGAFFFKHDATHVTEAVIYLSRSRLETFERKVRSLLHEMCHAYVLYHERDGARAGHNHVWKKSVRQCLASLPFIRKI